MVRNQQTIPKTVQRTSTQAEYKDDTSRSRRGRKISDEAITTIRGASGIGESKKKKVHVDYH